MKKALLKNTDKTNEFNIYSSTLNQNSVGIKTQKAKTDRY